MPVYFLEPQRFYISDIGRCIKSRYWRSYRMCTCQLGLGKRMILIVQKKGWTLTNSQKYPLCSKLLSCLVNLQNLSIHEGNGVLHNSDAAILQLRLPILSSSINSLADLCHKPTVMSNVALLCQTLTQC